MSWSCSRAIAAGVVVSGQVQNDLNSNGNLVEGDPGIPGVTLKLYLDNGSGTPTGPALATVTTDSGGNYSFSGIAVGNYIIVETNLANYASSGDSQGANDDNIQVSIGTFDKTDNLFLDVDTTRLDYGDAPDTYGTKLNGATTATTGGARHIRDGKLYLGTGVTGETDGQPNPTATADPFDGGIAFSPSLGQSYSKLIQVGISDPNNDANKVQVTASGTGYLNAWIDYNQNGVFDAGEQIFTNQLVNAGTSLIAFPTPPPNTLLHGLTMARFRLSPMTVTSPSAIGLIAGGEVEDYQVNVADPVPNGALCTSTGLLNGAFEIPSNGTSGFVQISETTVPGWNTTSPDGLIEIWKSGFNGVLPFEGNQFAEINATQSSALFQDIATVPGATLTWQIAHRARSGIDVMDIKAGSPAAPTLLRRVSSDTSGWVVYQGTYLVPAGQYITRLQFEAVSTGSGSASVGNFLDGVQFSTNVCITPIFPPTLDLDANNSTGATGNNFRGKFAGSSVVNAATDSDVTITDEKTNIASATITLTNRPDTTNESLSIDPTGGGVVPPGTVTASTYNSSTGVLTLSGTTTLANYAKIIATLKYQNAKVTPTSSDRIISIQVIDSDGLRSNLALSTLSLKLPPTLDLDSNDSSGAAGSNYNNTFVAGAGAISAIDTDVVVNDDGANLASATIILTNRPDNAAESLSIDPTVVPGGLITASVYNATTGQLTLTGNTTLTNYQKVLATLKYNNTATNPTLSPRIINVQVLDANDSFFSNTAVSTLQIINPLLQPAKVLLVKRVTEINGDRIQNPNVSSYQLNQVRDEPAYTPDDAYPIHNWPNNFLVGAYDAGPVKPGDTVEYTIYFVNSSGGSASRVKLCDRIVGAQQFLADAYGTGKDIEYKLGTNAVQYLTKTSSPSVDRAELNPSVGSITGCPNPGITGTNNGTVTIDITGNGSSSQQNLTALPAATTQGTPSNSYGYFRFKTKINP